MKLGGSTGSSGSSIEEGTAKGMPAGGKLQDHQAILGNTKPGAALAAAPPRLLPRLAASELAPAAAAAAAGCGGAALPALSDSTAWSLTAASLPGVGRRGDNGFSRLSAAGLTQS